MPYSHYIIIDTETSGVPERMDVPLDDEKRWPYILQLAWLVLDDDGNLVKEENHYLKNPKVKLDPQSQQIHGITPQLLKAKGVSKRGMLKRLYKDVGRYDALIVGHFVEFDLKMLTVEAKRAGMHLDLEGLPVYCTMLHTGVKSHHPDRQHPSLQELYESFFHKPMENPHNALHDARAAALVFLHLLERGKINPSDISVFNIDSGQAEAEKGGTSTFFQKVKNLFTRS